MVLSFREIPEALWYVRCPLDAFSWLAWWAGERDVHRSTSLGSTPGSPSSATGFWATPKLHQQSKSPPLSIALQPLQFTTLNLWTHPLSMSVMIITLLLGTAVVIITVAETCASARQTQSVMESVTAPMMQMRKTVVNDLYNRGAQSCSWGYTFLQSFAPTLMWSRSSKTLNNYKLLCWNRVGTELCSKPPGLILGVGTSALQ